MREGIANWLGKLSIIIENESAPTFQAKANDSEKINLTDGQIFQPSTNQVVWIEIDAGYGRWLGKEEFTITPAAKEV